MGAHREGGAEIRGSASVKQQTRALIPHTAVFPPRGVVENQFEEVHEILPLAADTHPFSCSTCFNNVPNDRCPSGRLLLCLASMTRDVRADRFRSASPDSSLVRLSCSRAQDATSRLAGEASAGFPPAEQDLADRTGWRRPEAANECLASTRTSLRSTVQADFPSNADHTLL